MRHVNVVSEGRFIMRANVDRLDQSFGLIKAMDDSHPFIDGSELEVPRNDKYAINLLLLANGQPLKIDTDFDGFNYFETATFLGTNHELLVAILSAMPYTDLDVLMKNWYRIKQLPEAKQFERCVLNLVTSITDIKPYVDYLNDFSFPTQFTLRVTHKMNVADFVSSQKIVPQDFFYGGWDDHYKLNKHFREVYATADARAYIPAKAVKDIMWIFIYADAYERGETQKGIYYLKPIDREKVSNMYKYAEDAEDFFADNEIPLQTNFSIVHQFQSHIVKPAPGLNPKFESGESNPVVFVDNDGNYYVTTEIERNYSQPKDKTIISIEGELEAIAPLLPPGGSPRQTPPGGSPRH
jgi:hypothetical protein